MDATCGNGYDTLAMLKMVADETGKGCVYGLDVQSRALESTSFLLEESADPDEVPNDHFFELICVSYAILIMQHFMIMSFEICSIFSLFI